MTLFSCRRVLVLAGGLGLLLAVLVGYYSVNLAEVRRLEIFGEAPAFTLTDHLERPVRDDQFRGQVVLANFIYTHCPDICPLLSAQMQGVQARLRQEGILGSRVQLLSFTVDPARDTPAVLRAYAERHQADPEAWRFLTGPEDMVVPLVVKGFYLGVQVLPSQATRQIGQGDHTSHEAAYAVMHSGRFVLIDREGRIRAYYDGNEFEPEQVMRDIRQLLR